MPLGDDVPVGHQVSHLLLCEIRMVVIMKQSSFTISHLILCTSYMPMSKITHPVTFHNGIIEICGGEYESLNQSKTYLRLEGKKLLTWNKYFLGNNHMFTTVST